MPAVGCTPTHSGKRTPHAQLWCVRRAQQPQPRPILCVAPFRARAGAVSFTHIVKASEPVVSAALSVRARLLRASARNRARARARTHAHAHARTHEARTHARVRPHTHARTRTRTRTHARTHPRIHAYALALPHANPHSDQHSHSHAFATSRPKRGRAHACTLERSPHGCMCGPARARTADKQL
eukprot:4427621-Pleurochrysis_carterae.AAC.2